MSPGNEVLTIGKLHFVIVGNLPIERARRVVALTSRRTALPCVLNPSPLEIPLPILAHRDQLDADRLLATLEGTNEADASLQVALTSQDMGSPLFTFFFGRARLHGTTALVSLARLDPAYYGLPADPEMAHRRAVSEVLHELGHNFGLHHCEDHACLMHLASRVEAIDLRGSTYCPPCSRGLPSGFLAH